MVFITLGIVLHTIIILISTMVITIMEGITLQIIIEAGVILHT